LALKWMPVAAICGVFACATPLTGAAAPKPSAYLFAWTNAPDSAYLATIDVSPTSRTRGQVVAALPVGVRGGRAHHTEHELGTTATLLANLFDAGRTFLFDLHDPLAPRIAASFDDLGPYSHPHSFVRLPDGSVLATFQHGGAHGSAAGGLVEFSPTGGVIRTSVAADSGYAGFVRPYSLAVVARLNRVVTTGYDMHQQGTTRVVQVWRLSDLALLHTIELPNGKRGEEGLDSGEPRLLSDGTTVLVATYRCGLYRMTRLDSVSPAADLVYDFGGHDCALPVLVDRFWIQTVPPNSIVTLDVSRPRTPREVARLDLQPSETPHWIAREPDGRRVAITGVGALLDERFVDKSGQPGIRLERGVPHGVVFSRER
jgi:hypothetical protein